MAKYKTTPLTEEQKAIGGTLLKTYNNLCLMSVFMPKLDRTVAVVATHEENPDKSVNLHPLFIVVDNAMWGELEDPATEVEDDDPGPDLRDGDRDPDGNDRYASDPK